MVSVDTDGHVLTPELRIRLDAMSDLLRDDILLPGDHDSAGAEDSYQGTVPVRPDPVPADVRVQEAVQVQADSGSSTPVIMVSGDRLNITAGAAHSLLFDLGAPDLADTRTFVGRDNVTNLVTGNDAANYLFGGSGDDKISGGGGNDLLVGRDGSDILFGGDGDDRLVGGDGIDYLVGGEGADTLVGGDSSDAFLYGALSETLGDVIVDFNRADGDRVCLYGIDANATQPGEQTFGFSGETPAAHSLWYQVADDNQSLTLYGDVDGNASTHEMAVTMLGVTHLFSSDIVDGISIPGFSLHVDQTSFS